jgi:hypothetical protein
MSHRAHVAHHSKGRLRLRVPSAKGDSASLQKIAQSLAPIPGVREVTLNEILGTITIHYESQEPADFCRHLTKGEGTHRAAFQVPVPTTEADEAIEMWEKEAAFLAEHSHSAKLFFGLFKRLDTELKKATNNNVDLKVMAPLGLAIYAFLELGFEVATPVWLTLGLFSFNHFITIHTPSSPGTKPSLPSDRL